jgi:hypothetical protein
MRTRHWGAGNEQEQAGMKYIPMMSGTTTDFDEYAHWPEEVLQANMAFMRSLVDTQHGLKPDGFSVL